LLTTAFFEEAQEKNKAIDNAGNPNRSNMVYIARSLKVWA
jgi:hypothetical protein